MSKAKSSNSRGPTKTVIRRPWIENGACVGIKMDGQPYRYVRTGFYQSEVTGNVTQVDYYSSECRECGTPMEVFEPSDNAGHFYPARRCKACSANGRASDGDEAPQPAPTATAQVLSLHRFKPGARVRHAKFGNGTILTVDQLLEGGIRRGPIKLRTQFDDLSIGIRTVVGAFVELI